jgi:aspartate/methionine/tyrosine aminotransferase
MLLKEAVGSLLGVARRVSQGIRTTFSGSVAVDRVFTAMRLLAAESGRNGLTAIIAEPSIDFFRLLLEDRPDVNVVSVPFLASSLTGRRQVELLIEALDVQSKTFPGRQIFVVLDSPANPSGAVASAEDLSQLAVECGRTGALLVMDHCFLLAGVHAPERLPTVFDVPAEACDWVGIWDTGKTMDLSGDKLGFILPGNARVARAVDRSLSVIQSSPARRSLIVFSQLLGHPRLKDYVERLGRACRANLDVLRSGLPEGALVATPVSGTFACVRLPGYNNSSDSLRTRWLTAGVSTVSGRTFFSARTPRDQFVRIALARTEDYFHEAISRLIP